MPRTIAFKDAERANPRLFREAYDKSNVDSEKSFKDNYKRSTPEERQMIDAIFIRHGLKIMFENGRISILNDVNNVVGQMDPLVRDLANDPINDRMRELEQQLNDMTTMRDDAINKTAQQKMEIEGVKNQLKAKRMEKYLEFTGKTIKFITANWSSWSINS